jgi:hypothetical protein
MARVHIFWGQEHNLRSTLRTLLRFYQPRANTHLVTAAYTVTALMFFICHKRRLHFNSNLTELYIERLMKRGRREDWPSVFVVMCSILFAVENFAVNVHIFSPEIAYRVDERIEMEGVEVLPDRFKAYTRGINPLDLDWSLPKNQGTLQGNDSALMFSRSLQEVSKRYL